MSETEETHAHSLGRWVVRGVIGGTLMGLANLVPGISGGTMLLAAGVYPAFIDAIAELTTLRFRLRPLVLLAVIAGAAAVAILLLAGTVKGLVQDHRWIMYSLFIGLTLGGVPLIWRLARPLDAAVGVAAAASFGLMAWMALGSPAGDGGDGQSPLLMGLAGLAASSAMILPGVSGGYLLLLLGQYERILGTVDQLKQALSTQDLALLVDALGVVIPLGIGVALGIVGVSNLLHWLLHHYEKATLGALLGLLLGAVVGLWPFQEGRVPRVGEVIDGRTVDASNLHAFDVDDWPVEGFDPTAGQMGTSLLLVGAGLAATLLIGRLGDDETEA